jgi:hypothetical protein
MTKSSSHAASPLLHTRAQHAVGQGGFHTADLATIDTVLNQSAQPITWSAFHYVYDCGSRQTHHCRSRVNDYAALLAGAAIDLLFVSHFDSDHVNGLPFLLDKTHGARCDTVVLPFVDDVERLISFGRSVQKGEEIGEFFRALIVDPVQAIDAFGPRRIVLMRSGTPDPRDRDIVDPGREDDDRDPDLKRPFRAKVKIDGRASGGISTSHVMIASDNAPIEVAVGSDMLWLLKPYVRTCDPLRIEMFERDAEARLGFSTGSFRTTIAKPVMRNHLVSCPRCSRALADSYKAVFRDRNLTSLCVFSGPSKSTTSAQPHFVFREGEMTAKVGWLGTGDVSLRTLKEADEFLMHFADHIGDVSAFGLPHHGSIRNYSGRVVGTLNPKDCFASAKPPGNWKHPHPDVIADVVSKGSQSHLVDDRESSAFREIFMIW